MAEPTYSYLIASTPRSGSTLLCEALRNTGVAGRPEEYYQHRRKTGLPRRPREYFEDGAETPEIFDVLGDYTRVDDELTLYDPRRFPSYRSYRDWTIQEATTPNGVFGAKVMWGYFNGFVDSLRDLLGNAVLPTRKVLEQSFPNLEGWIFVSRSDKVRQAVSLWKAIQTWTWSRDSSDGHLLKHDLRYSFDGIDHLTRQLEDQDREWLAFFEESGIDAFAVVYEDFVQRYEGTALDILHHLGIAAPADVAFGQRRMTRQADERSERWVNQYRHDLEQRRAPTAM
ncbi:MAG: trehalose 2-sulfotransferase [Gaiellales bacterium]|jgi:LPS sulfotransferase NodH|nr:trehalose 2-sulfotransferase [Gaiellales bacterium]